MNKKRLIGIGILIFLIGLGAGAMISGGDSSDGHNHAGSPQTGNRAEVWTCSMHPQIRQPGPGKCPICGMDLIPVKDESGEKLNPGALKLSESARRLAEIRTEKVKREFVPVEVRMTGKVRYDETRLAYITARIPGRLDRLYVNYTGIPIQKGEHMVRFYSPALFTAQEELLQAIRAKSSAEGALKRDAELLVEAARGKLRLWDITDSQIKQIEQRGTADEYMTINAPLGGIVIGKHVEEGAYVKTGAKIYTIADLTHLWVFLDAYESELQWLKYGQKAEFSAEAYPGKIFTGMVSFIDPVLDEKTRTVRVRVTVDNSKGLLKPGMFVRALVKATVTADGAVVERDLAGKWICPMHPEVIKDEPGSCDICGMPLSSAESLGYVDTDTKPVPPLVIPASAPLITGKRAVVYIRTDKDGDIFEGRDVVLGPRAGNYYVVESGLSEEDIVVTSGNFKIDSALQILAKPSMMSPEDEMQETMKEKEPGMKDNMNMNRKNLPETFLQKLKPLYDSYFQIQKALAQDDFKTGHAEAEAFHSALAGLNTDSLSGKALEYWSETAERLMNAAMKLHSSSDLEGLRLQFSRLSELMTALLRSTGYTGKGDITRFTCPMAFDNRGATWLQNSSELKNPYFGSTMLKCGEQNEVFPSMDREETGKKEEGNSDHEH